MNQFLHLKFSRLYPHFVLAHLMSLLKNWQKVSKANWTCWRSLSEREEIGFIFFSIIMYKSPSTFMKGCTKVKPHKWYVMLNLPYTLEGRKKRKERSKRHGHSGMAELKGKRKETSKAIRPMRAKERDFGWSKVKISGLHLLWLDVKSVKGRKEGKDEEINREAIWPVQRWRKEVKVPKCED